MSGTARFSIYRTLERTLILFGLKVSLGRLRTTFTRQFCRIYLRRSAPVSVFNNPSSMTVQISPPGTVDAIIFWRKRYWPFVDDTLYCVISSFDRESPSAVPNGGLVIIKSQFGVLALQFCALAERLSSCRMFVCPSPAIIIFILAEAATPLRWNMRYYFESGSLSLTPPALSECP